MFPQSSRDLSLGWRKAIPRMLQIVSYLFAATLATFTAEVEDSYTTYLATVVALLRPPISCSENQSLQA
jgi:hypothetical protein